MHTDMESVNIKKALRLFLQKHVNKTILLACLLIYSISPVILNDKLVLRE